MGRDACESGVGHLGEGASSNLYTQPWQQQEWQSSEDAQLFFIDVYGSANCWDWQTERGTVCYDSLGSIEVLGDASETSEKRVKDESRCFNCGSPAHFLSSCPHPRDFPLIHLSRQIASFFRNDDANQVMRRIHVVEGWKQQRLEWIASFQPDEIRGPLLREALGIDRGDMGSDVPWLKNMLFWGYPKGWTGETDPKEKVRRRILGDVDSAGDGGQQDLDSSMVIFGDDGQNEEIDLNVQALESRTENLANDATTAESYRWASYPGSHFLYTQLPIYSGQTLPPVGYDESTEFTASLSATDPWDVCRADPFEQPPPPAISPPPLPLSPSRFPFDPNDDQSDMDLSE